MNKHNKRLISLIVAIMVIMLAFVGCGGDGIALQDTATVVIVGAETKTYSVDLKEAKFTTQNTTYDVLRYLADKETLKLNGTVSGYGVFLTEIGDLKPTGNQFIELYHNKADDKRVGEFAKEIKYNDVTLYNSGLGVSDTKLVDGIIIYFTISTF